MFTWKRISCAVDFSDPSHSAMLASAELARQLGAELALVHVHTPDPSAFMEVPVRPGDPTARAAAAAVESTMARWRGEAERLAHRRVHSSIRVGDPAAAIVCAVRDDDADVLVVGTHGRRGLARLALGSVAERIVREAPCAVLVVRTSAARAADAVQASEEETPPPP